MGLRPSFLNPRTLVRTWGTRQELVLIGRVKCQDNSGSELVFDWKSEVSGYFRIRAGFDWKSEVSGYFRIRAGLTGRVVTGRFLNAHRGVRSTFGQYSVELLGAKAKIPIEFAAVLLVAWGQISLPQTAPTVDEDLHNCRVHQLRDLPGSHQFASSFLEAIAIDPMAADSRVVWGLTADLSSTVPAEERALYVSKSSDGGKSWTEVARVDSKYLDAGIGEGERNGLGVAPGGDEFVVTTQRGAFQVLPQS